MCAAARFHNRLGFKKSCSVSQALGKTDFSVQMLFETSRSNFRKVSLLDELDWWFLTDGL